MSMSCPVSLSLPCVTLFLVCLLKTAHFEVYLSSPSFPCVLARDIIPDQNSKRHPFSPFCCTCFESLFVFLFFFSPPRHRSRRSSSRLSLLKFGVGVLRDRHECCESAGRSSVKFAGRSSVQPAGCGYPKPAGRSSVKSASRSSVQPAGCG